MTIKKEEKQFEKKKAHPDDEDPIKKKLNPIKTEKDLSNPDVVQQTEEAQVYFLES